MRGATVRRAETAAIELQDELRAKEGVEKDRDSAKRRAERKALLDRSSMIQRDKPEKEAQSRIAARGETGLEASPRRASNCSVTSADSEAEPTAAL